MNNCYKRSRPDVMETWHKGVGDCCHFYRWVLLFSSCAGFVLLGRFFRIKRGWLVKERMLYIGCWVLRSLVCCKKGSIKQGGCEL